MDEDAGLVTGLMDVLGELPAELRLHVVSFLSPAEMHRCAAVCKKWRSLIPRIVNIRMDETEPLPQRRDCVFSLFVEVSLHELIASVSKYRTSHARSNACVVAAEDDRQNRELLRRNCAWLPRLQEDGYDVARINLNNISDKDEVALHLLKAGMLLRRARALSLTRCVPRQLLLHFCSVRELSITALSGDIAHCLSICPSFNARLDHLAVTLQAYAFEQKLRLDHLPRAQFHADFLAWNETSIHPLPNLRVLRIRDSSGTTFPTHERVLVGYTLERDILRCAVNVEEVYGLRSFFSLSLVGLAGMCPRIRMLQLAEDYWLSRYTMGCLLSLPRLEHLVVSGKVFLTDQEFEAGVNHLREAIKAEPWHWAFARDKPNLSSVPSMEGEAVECAALERVDAKLMSKPDILLSLSRCPSLTMVRMPKCRKSGEDGNTISHLSPEALKSIRQEIDQRVQYEREIEERRREDIRRGLDPYRRLREDLEIDLPFDVDQSYPQQRRMRRCGVQ